MTPVLFDMLFLTLLSDSDITKCNLTLNNIHFFSHHLHPTNISMVVRCRVCATVRPLQRPTNNHTHSTCVATYFQLHGTHIKHINKLKTCQQCDVGRFAPHITLLVRVEFLHLHTLNIYISYSHTLATLTYIKFGYIYPSDIYAAQIHMQLGYICSSDTYTANTYMELLNMPH